MAIGILRVATVAAVLSLLLWLGAADRCNFPQYHPTRVSIRRNGTRSGIYVQRPFRSGTSFAYPDEWTHLVVQGMGYSPVPTGWELSKRPNGDFYGVDYKYIWERDLRRMKAMGVNVLRVWNWNFMGSSQHQAFLDALWELEMYILVPFMMGTINDEGQLNYEDLHAVTTRQKVIEDWSVFVASHSNHPAVLGYLVGNELEKTVYKDQMSDFFSLLNLMVEMSHETEREAQDLHINGTWFYHPISSPFASDSFKSFYEKYYDWINIDFWSLQPYADNEALLSDIYEFEQWMNRTNLFGEERRYVPMLLTERGFSALTNVNADGRNAVLDEDHQAEMLRGSWIVVQNFTNHTCLGMCVMEWNDEWWKGTASDVQNKGCPNPFATVHANCSTVITSSNTSFRNMTLVYEEYLGICEQQGPKEQPVVNKAVSSPVLRYIFNFLAPVNTYCIRPRKAYFVLQELWFGDQGWMDGEPLPTGTLAPIENTTTNDGWWCGTISPEQAFFRNPLVLVWLPSISVLTISLIIACTKCGVRKEERRAKRKRDAKAVMSETTLNANYQSTSNMSLDSMPMDQEELLPSQLAFSQARQNRRARKSALYNNRVERHQRGEPTAAPPPPPPVPLPFEPEMRHVTQLIFDKLDAQSLGTSEQLAKDHVQQLVRAMFEEELAVSPALASRFGVVGAEQADVTAASAKAGAEDKRDAAGEQGNDPAREEGAGTGNDPAHDGKDPKAADGDGNKIMCLGAAPSGTEEAVRVVHFRLFEGYGLWLQRVHGKQWERPTGDEAVAVMIRELVIFTLLRDVAATINHAPELMAFLFHELTTKDQPDAKRDAWEQILDEETGLLRKLYDSLSDKKNFMSLDDFNILGLSKDGSIAKLTEPETVFKKTFPERGGLYVLFANYAWITRLFLWMWIFGWYMQPVHLGRALCVSDALNMLATLDSAVYAATCACVVGMLVGSPIAKFAIGKSVVLGLVHVLVCFLLLAKSPIIMNQSEVMYGIKGSGSLFYTGAWVLASLAREIYLFSSIAFGEHGMRGTYAAAHGRPRMVFGIALAVGVAVALGIALVLTSGGNAESANVALGFIDSGFWKPFVLVMVAVVAAPLASRAAGKVFKDMRSVVEVSPVVFWVVFGFLLVLINIFWLVPSVTNLRFAICECQTQKLNLSTETCDWRNHFACQVAVILTWAATFYVSFVVGYALFVGCSLACGIAVAKVNQIGSVREWDDVASFGNDIILNNFKYLSWAAEDPDVARHIWNAFIDSMYKGYLLELSERDSYMFQVHTVEVYRVLGHYFLDNIGDETERRVVCECIATLAERKHDAIVLMKGILLPDGIYSALKRQRRLLMHRLRMALSAHETLFDHGPSAEAANFAKVLKAWKLLDHYKPIKAGHAGDRVEGESPRQGEAAAAAAEADRQVERRTQDLDAIMTFFAAYSPSKEESLDNFVSAWGEDGDHLPADPKRPDELPEALRWLLHRSQVADFHLPPRNEEAARRCIHQLWSVECVKNEVLKREKLQSVTGSETHSEQYLQRQSHRVATMPSCTTIIPYYAETVLYEFEEVIATFDQCKTRISYLEYITCQYPQEWTNFVENETWLMGRFMPTDASKRVQYCGEFLDKCLAGDLTSEQKHRICMFVTYRGQTLGRTLRGLEALRHGMKVIAMLEERDTFHDQYRNYAIKVQGYKADGSDIDEVALHEYCASQVQRMVDTKYQVIVAAQVYTPAHLRPKGMKADQRQRDEHLDRLQKSLTFDIVCNHDASHRSFFIPSTNPEHPTWIRRPGLLRVSKDPMRATEGKPENQLHAIPFAIGEVLNTFDMNQDDTIEMGFKHPLLVGLFWNPKPRAFDLDNKDELLYTPKYRIVGFAEHTYTRPLSLVGELMGAAEFCFVTITQRVLSKPLGVRAHYGHPDYVDGYWARTRGGMSKASNVVNVNEDIFCGYEMISRGQKITFVEWMQAQKGRESAFVPAFVFESKLAGGAGQQVRSRDIFFLNLNLDIFSRLSVVFGTLGFYIINFLMGASIHYFIWAIVLFRASNTTFHQLGIMQAKIAVAWVFQLGYVLAFPLLIENFVERGLLRGLQEFFRTIVPSIFFFVFHLQTKFYYFMESIVRGKAGYKPTGRGFCIDRVSLLTIYKTFGQSHIHEALVYLVMLLIYRYLSDEDTFSFVMRCLTIIFIVISWFAAPLFFQPHPTFQQIALDWKEVREWLMMPAQKAKRHRRLVPPSEGEVSWEAWHINELISYWEDEEVYYNSFHIITMALLRAGIAYVPWSCLFLIHISQATMYLVILIFVVQLMHLILVRTIDKSQHHHLSVIELLVLAIGLPLVLWYYFQIATVRFADVAFGTCIYLVAASFLLDMRTMLQRQLYRIRLRRAARDSDEFKEARTRVARGITPYRQATAGICLFILYCTAWVLCFFKNTITSVNYSAAAAFAWERVTLQPRVIRVKAE